MNRTLSCRKRMRPVEGCWGGKNEDVQKGTSTDPCRREILREVRTVAGRQGSDASPRSFRIHSLQRKKSSGIETRVRGMRNQG